MTVMLKSLRITSEYDPSGFVQGAQQQLAAQQAMIAGSEAWAVSLAAVDVAANKLPAGMARLSRAYIDGYTQAQKFEKEIRSVEKAMDQGMSAERATVIYQNLANKFDLMADAAVLAKQGLVGLAPIVNTVNASIEATITAANDAAIAMAKLNAEAADQAAISNVNREMERRNAIMVAQAGEMDRLTQKYNPAAAAARAYETEIAGLNSALALGVIKQNEYAAAVQRAQASYQNASAKPIYQVDQGAQPSNPSGALARQSMAVFEAERIAAEEDQAAIARVSAEIERREKISIQAATAEAAALSALQAKYDPLMAAMVNYDQELARITAAEKQGIISKTAMTDAIAALQARMQNLGTPTGAVEVRPSIIGGASAGIAAAASARAMEDARMETEAMAKSAANLRAQLDPVGAAFVRLSTDIAEYDRLLEAGAINHNEYAQAVSMAQQGLVRTAPAMKAVQQNARLTNFEITNLAYQFSDIGVMMASGQNPFVMMMQQGSQIGQVFTAKGASIVQTLRGIGTAFVSFVTNPINIAILGLAALAWAGKAAYDALASGGKAFEDHLKTQKALLDDIKAAYGSLGDAITRVAPERIPVLQLKAQIDVQSIQKQLESAIDSFAQSAGTIQGRYARYLPTAALPIKEAIAQFREELQKGNPDLDAFRERIANVAMSVDSIDTKRAVLQILTLTDTLAEAKRNMDAMSGSTDQLRIRLLRNTQAINALIGQQPGSQPKTLQSFIPDLTPARDQLNQTYQLMIHLATSMSEVEGITAKWKSGLAELDNEQRRAADLAKLDLESISAKSPLEKAHIAAMREQIAVETQAMSAKEKQIAVERAYKQALDEATYAIDQQNKQELKAANDNLRNAQLDTQLVGATNAQQDLARANLQTRIQLENEAFDRGQKFDQTRYDELVKINEQHAKEIDLLAQKKLAYDLEIERRAAAMAPDEAAIFTRLKGAGIEENTAAWQQLAQAMRDANTESMSFTAGLKTGFYEALHNINDFADSAKTILGDFFSGLEDQWVKFAQTGKFNFKDMINSMIADISRLAYRMVMSGLFGMLGFGNTASPNPLGSAMGGAGLLGSLFGGGGGGSAPGAAPGGATQSPLAGVGNWFSNLFGLRSGATPGGGAVAPSQAGAPAATGGVAGWFHNLFGGSTAAPSMAAGGGVPASVIPAQPGAANTGPGGLAAWLGSFFGSGATTGQPGTAAPVAGGAPPVAGAANTGPGGLWSWLGGMFGAGAGTPAPARIGAGGVPTVLGNTVTPGGSIVATPGIQNYQPRIPILPKSGGGSDIGSIAGTASSAVQSVLGGGGNTTVLQKTPNLTVIEKNVPAVVSPGNVTTIPKNSNVVPFPPAGGTAVKPPLDPGLSGILNSWKGGSPPPGFTGIWPPDATGHLGRAATNGNLPQTLLSPSNDNIAPFSNLGTKTGKELFSFGPHYGQGVDPRLTEILRGASEATGMRAEAFSGVNARPQNPRSLHPGGMATDINLFGPNGKPLPNYQNGPSFRSYEEFAQAARGYQQARFPELDNKFRWGGYFGGPPGKYGAMDQMHFDLGGYGKNGGMAGGSWAGGLTEAQRRLFPSAQSIGIGQGQQIGLGILPPQGLVTPDLSKLLTPRMPMITPAKTTGGIGAMGGMALSWLQQLLGMFFKDGGAFDTGGVRKFAYGAGFSNTIIDHPTMFAYGSGNLGIAGEAGPEAIMPLERRGGKLGVRVMNDNRKSPALRWATEPPGGKPKLDVPAGMTPVHAAPTKVVNITQHNTFTAPGMKEARQSQNQMAAAAAAAANRSQRTA